MVVATPAPKPAYPNLLWVAYVYAAALTVSAVLLLMGVGGFDFAHITFATPGSPVLAVIGAGLEIYAIPFVLRLPLSRLARFFSAFFAVAAPVFMLGYICYAASENLVQNAGWMVAAGIALLALGVASFAALDGRRALRFSKK